MGMQERRTALGPERRSRKSVNYYRSFSALRGGLARHLHRFHRLPLDRPGLPGAPIYQESLLMCLADLHALPKLAVL